MGSWVSGAGVTAGSDVEDILGEEIDPNYLSSGFSAHQKTVVYVTMKTEAILSPPRNAARPWRRKFSSITYRSQHMYCTIGQCMTGTV